MTKMERNEWNAEKRSYEKIFLGINSKAIKVADIEPDNAGVLGYTSKNGSIHIAFEHEIMKRINKVQRKAFRKGVFAHEMLHQIFTDFDGTIKKLSKLPYREKRVFMQISNILEDPAIEFFAPEVIGGSTLKSLQYCIAHIYKSSPDIEEIKNPFGQWITALIQFGDMGLLKGKFTFPEAKDMFSKTAYLFAEGIETPDPKERLDISEKIMEISRPLWEKCDQYLFDEMMEELLKHLENMGKDNQLNSNSGPLKKAKGNMGDKKKQKQRKITFRKISKEEMEERKENKEENDGEIPDGDIEVLYCDEDFDSNKDDNKDESVGISLGDGKKESEDENPDDCSTPAGKTNDSKEDTLSKEPALENEKTPAISDSDKEEDRSESDTGSEVAEDCNKHSDSDKVTDSESETGYKQPDSNESEQRSGEGQKINYDFDNLEKDIEDSIKSNEMSDSEDIISFENYEIDDSDIDKIENDINKALDEINESSKKELDSDNSQLPDFDIKSPVFKGVRCNNKNIQIRDPEKLQNTYEQLVSKMLPKINSISNQLKRIFIDDREEWAPHTSGKINLLRASGSRITPKVFDKRREPAFKSDFVVEILVDESGSMSGGKCEAARKTCIALAEIFGRFHIPLYVFGFTERSTVQHHHYIKWKNTPGERLKLLNICSGGCNFDGYSIRYATEIIKAKNAEHKLLIVISDGQPASSFYSGATGVIDTKQAIKDARKITSILGVGIGNADTAILKSMYGDDFLHVSNVDDLFNGIISKVKKIVRKW